MLMQLFCEGFNVSKKNECQNDTYYSQTNIEYHLWKRNEIILHTGPQMEANE